jgi:hypothetical protein
LVVVIGILYVPVFGQIEPNSPEYDPLLIGQANPTLAGIDNLYVWIIPHGFQPNSHGLVFEELENLVTDRLKKAGITVAETDIDRMEPNSVPAKMAKILKRRIESAENLKFRPSRIPELCVDMDMLVLKHLQQAVFHTQISLARLVHLEKGNRLTFKTDVWQSEPIMQVVSAENMPDKVTEVVLKQVDGFIAAWHAANPKDKQPSDANEISIVPKEQIKPAIKVAESEYKYVASKNSKVFHKSTCTWANRISPENLVHYKTREDAINDGKRPCKQCEP